MSRFLIFRVSVSIVAGLVLGSPALTSAAEQEDPPPITALGVQPGENGLIVYDQERRCGDRCNSYSGARPGIYTFDPSTGKRKLLVKGARANSPRFAAKGNQIVYSDQVFGQQDIFLTATNGAKTSRMTDDQDVELDPFFVPSGWIGFHLVDGQPFRYYRMDRYAGRRQPAGPYDSLRSTGSTPRKGSDIAYTSCVSRTGSCHVFVKRTGGSVDQLTNGEVRDSNASFSADGGHIIHLRGRSGERVGQGDEVWTMNSDGTEPRLLSKAAGDERFTGAMFSPDGRKVLVERYVPNASGKGGRGWIELIGLNGGKAQRIQGQGGQGVLSATDWQSR